MSSSTTPAEAFHFTEFFREEMAARAWDWNELVRAAWPVEYEDAVILRLLVAVADDPERGRKIKIDRATAVLLGRAFETSADYWMNLDAAYWANQPPSQGRE